MEKVLQLTISLLSIILKASSLRTQINIRKTVTKGLLMVAHQTPYYRIFMFRL